MEHLLVGFPAVFGAIVTGQIPRQCCSCRREHSEPAGSRMIVLLVAVVLLAVVLGVRWLLAYVKFRKLELAIPGPRSLPILGNAFDLLFVTEDTVFERIIEIWGHRSEMTRVSVGRKLIVFVSDPADIGELMKRKDFNGKSDLLIYPFLAHEAPNGLVQLNGAKWKEHRKCLAPAFHPEVIDPYVEAFAEEAEGFVDRIMPGMEMDLHDPLALVAGTNFMRTTMTMALEASGKKMVLDVIHLLKLLFSVVNKRSLSPWLWPNFIYSMTRNSFRISRSRKTVFAYTDSIISEKRSKCMPEVHDQVNGRRRTMVDILLKNRHDGKNQLDDNEIKDEIVTFLGAAVDTTVSALCSTFKVLSMMPDVQERLHAEILEVLGNTKRSVALDDLPRLVYLERVLQETMRLLSPVPFIVRKTKEMTELSGKVLPAGTQLVINIFGAHRDPRHWPDPDRFDPDRFLPERSQGRHPYAFIPFSAGPRSCIGSRYGMMAMKTMVATVLRDFRVDPVDDGITKPCRLPLSFDLTLQITGGAKVKFSRR